MIKLYDFELSVNCYKQRLLMSILGVPFEQILIDFFPGWEHKGEEFKKINPLGHIPVIDDDGYILRDAHAILVYLAEKSGRFIPATPLGRKEVLEWLFWQVGNLGPMAGQISHFVNYAPGENDYARRRYANEYDRCIGVLERRLSEREYIVGDYSIADMAAWPWLIPYRHLGQSLEPYPHVRRWHEAMKARPAVRAGVDLGKELRRSAPPSEEERDVLFNQSAAKSAAAAASWRGKPR